MIIFIESSTTNHYHTPGITGFTDELKQTSCVGQVFLPLPSYTALANTQTRKMLGTLVTKSTWRAAQVGVHRHISVPGHVGAILAPQCISCRSENEFG